MEHQHKKFEQELSDLREKVGQMGELAIDQLRHALRDLTDHDVSNARRLIERDASLNRLDVEIEERCLQLLALHQPVAADLRTVAAAMKITTELERVGDRVVNICEAIHDREEDDAVAAHAEIAEMGSLAVTMLADSVAAFTQRDAAMARRVFATDKQFDAIYGAAFPRVIAIRTADTAKAAQEAKLAFLLRDLNEISEHATNIAEAVIFMVAGKDPTHMDLHERRSIG
ncbi:phosphate signaling complex protein PhoU [bacterium]|nr:phosphate signaling complex protein PhoU [bacterium]